MTNAQVFTSTTRGAYQHGLRLVGERLCQRRGAGRLDTALPDFHKAGTSLHRTSAANQAQATHTRTKGCLYRQAAGEFGHPPETTGRIDREVTERFSQPSTGSLSAQREAWLRSVRKGASSFATIMIGYSARRFCRFTACWYRTGSGG